MSAPTSAQERRLTPRTTIDPLAYISLEPDNGGIVLNLSEGGLCFHSTAPLQRAGTIHFSFSRRQQRIEGDGELAWIDPSDKRGGLRFTSLSAQAREQIRTWVTQPASSLDAAQDSRPQPSSWFEPPLLSATHPPMLEKPRRAPPLASLSGGTRAVPARRGFTAGLITGLAIAAIAAAAFLLHSYPHQVGESLIHLGERLAAKPAAKPVPPLAPLPPPMSSGAQPVSAAPAAPVPQKIAPEVNPQSISSNPEKQVSPIVVAQAHPTHAETTIAPAAPNLAESSSPPATRLPLFPDPHELAARPLPAPANEGTEVSPAKSETLVSHMYFDVGKFKQQLQAQRTADQLSGLGFPAEVLQKRSVWSDSYQVLVGPYARDAKAETAQQSLLSNGFPARAVERGSRSLVLRSGLTLNRTEMPSGEYDISWESYVTHAKVKFVQRGSAVTVAEGKWIKSAVKYDNDAIVFRINDDGSKTLLEILFAGMDRALTFR
jgi:cell division protein FtsN